MRFVGERKACAAMVLAFFGLLYLLNALAGPDVVVRSARSAPEGFSARHDATLREYRYRLVPGPVPPLFLRDVAWWVKGTLDVPAMAEGAAALVGEHDFGSFCRHPGAGRPTVRNLQRVTVARHGDRVALGFRANAFLHQMVRSLVGTLVRVGEGKLAPEEVARILAARDRSAAGQLAPARGLTLERVIYGRR
jgi:tRNA pseudouridine38-40 synthase